MGYKYNKEDILNVGFDVFRRNGYHSVGINQILKESNISKGSFYNYFESKEDFALQVINHYGISNCKWIQSFLEEFQGSALEKLKAFYNTLMDMNEKDDYSGGCLINNISMEVGRNNDILGFEANDHFTHWLQVLAKFVAQGQKDGEIKTVYSPLEIAEYLHAGFYGVLSRTKVTRNRIYMNTWFKMSFDFIKKLS